MNARNGGAIVEEIRHAQLDLDQGMVLKLGGRVVPPLTSAIAEPGETISIGPLRGGLYACLAVGGGFALQNEFGSLSQHRRSGIGGALFLNER